jgi:hypothetical protein
MRRFVGQRVRLGLLGRLCGWRRRRMGCCEVERLALFQEIGEPERVERVTD